MPTPDKRTLYEVLGIARTAKLTDINRAYNRIRAEMEKDSWAPDPRFAALAKLAHETLSDADKRAAYDRSLSPLAPVLAKKATGPIVAAVVGAVVAASAGAWYASARDDRPDGKMVEPNDLLQSVSNHVGRLQAALVSGEVRDLGTAVAVADGQMATTCRGFTPGATLSVRSVHFASHAELLRANDELGVCMLAVKSASAGLPLREGPLAARESVLAVVPSEKGPHSTRKGTVVRAVRDARGPIMELKFATPLPDGTPVFDAEGRLAGLVTTRPSRSSTTLLAFAASRIAQARAGLPSNEVLPSPAAPASPPATATATGPDTTARTVTPEGEQVPLPKKDPRQAAAEERFGRILEEADKAR